MAVVDDDNVVRGAAARKKPFEGAAVAVFEAVVEPLRVHECQVFDPFAGVGLPVDLLHVLPVEDAQLDQPHWQLGKEGGKNFFKADSLLRALFTGGLGSCEIETRLVIREAGGYAVPDRYRFDEGGHRSSP